MVIILSTGTATFCVVLVRADAAMRTASVGGRQRRFLQGNRTQGLITTIIWDLF
jgi:hypothetical protein